MILKLFGFWKERNRYRCALEKITKYQTLEELRASYAMNRAKLNHAPNISMSEKEYVNFAYSEIHKIAMDALLNKPSKPKLTIVK